MGIGQDITGRLTQEREYTRLIDTANALIVGVNTLGKGQRGLLAFVIGPAIVETGVGGLGGRRRRRGGGAVRAANHDDGAPGEKKDGGPRRRRTVSKEFDLTDFGDDKESIIEIKFNI